jgi:hypothetical protein
MRLQGEDWLIVCGMMRSASTVIFRATCELVQKHLGGVNAGYARPLEPEMPPKWAALWDDPRLKVTKAHEGNERITGLLDSGRMAGIYTYRDMHGVIVSLGRKNHWSFDQDQWMINCCEAQIRHQRYWMQWDNVLVIKYPDWVYDQRAQIERIMNFLGITINQGEIARVAQQYNVGRMRRYLKSGHVHEGEVGTWANYVTGEQAERIRAIVAEHLPEDAMSI